MGSYKYNRIPQAVTKHRLDLFLLLPIAIVVVISCNVMPSADAPLVPRTKSFSCALSPLRLFFFFFWLCLHYSLYHLAPPLLHPFIAWVAKLSGDISIWTTCQTSERSLSLSLLILAKLLSRTITLSTSASKVAHMEASLRSHLLWILPRHPLSAHPMTFGGKLILRLDSTKCLLGSHTLHVVNIPFTGTVASWTC